MMMDQQLNVNLVYLHVPLALTEQLVLPVLLQLLLEPELLVFVLQATMTMELMPNVPLVLLDVLPARMELLVLLVKHLLQPD
jgi:hypothetical protein